ncbi:MAG: hypothetical protein H6Q89_2737, partial [Myxococcaceae bacterium]|nr:hypothetical protein [Myxococcaceae bacterium]
PYGRWWSIPGVVRVSFLPAIATRQLGAADVPALADRVRTLMQTELRAGGSPQIAEARPLLASTTPLRG